MPALIVSGPGGAGEDAIVTGAELPSSKEAFSDPSWSPNGSRLILYDHGGTTLGGELADPAGIYVIEPMPNPAVARLLISAPEEAEGVYETLASPRFVGANTIAFVAGGSVWSVPANCDECAMASATKLVPGSSTAAEQALSVTWTSREVAPASVYPSQGGGPSPPTPTPEHKRRDHNGHGATLKLMIAPVHAPHPRKLLAKGLSVKARCSRAKRPQGPFRGSFLSLCDRKEPRKASVPPSLSKLGRPTATSCASRRGSRRGSSGLYPELPSKWRQLAATRAKG